MVVPSGLEIWGGVVAVLVRARKGKEGVVSAGWAFAGMARS